MGLLDVSFPGPRPYRVRESLLGRDNEIGEVLDLCATRDVITVTAWSGVGKTSFVQAGLLPRLERTFRLFPEVPFSDSADDVRAAPTRSWGQILRSLGDQTQAGTVTELAERVYRDIVGLGQDTGRRLAIDLRDHLGSDRAVVVLDQYEELLRYYGALGEALLRLVARVAPSVGPHIVVARSEYRERLRPVETALDVSVASWSLPEIGPSRLPEIFEGPFEAQGVQVDSAVTEGLVARWKQARQGTGADRLRQVGSEGLAEVGLLHFQSMALAFVEWIKANWTDLSTRHNEHHLTSALLDEYIEGRVRDGATDGGELFQDALVTYVRARANDLLRQPLRRPSGEGALGGGDAPLWWKQGPALLVARAASAFTVAGFKQPQALYSLLPLAMGNDASRDWPALADAIQSAPATALDLLAGESEGWEPAGIAAIEGRSGREILPEMIDGLHAGLVRLSDPDVNIFRRLERPGEPVFELVHDGMGSALKSWSSQYRARPLAHLDMISAQAGGLLEGVHVSSRMLDEELAWSGLGEEIWGSIRYDDASSTRWPVSEAADTRPIVLEAVKFPSAAFIGCRFENLTFRNCTFRGASFINCVFKNVVFEDCDLKALLFMGGSVLQHVAFTNRGGEEAALDLLTIKDPSVADDIAFEGLTQTTGIFLQRLPGGSWRFEDSLVRHLVVEALDDSLPVFAFENTDALAVSTSGDVELRDPSGRVREISLNLDRR